MATVPSRAVLVLLLASPRRGRERVVSKYEYRTHPATTTSSGAVTTYVATLTVVKVSRWTRLRRWMGRRP